MGILQGRKLVAVRAESVSRKEHVEYEHLTFLYTFKLRAKIARNTKRNRNSGQLYCLPDNASVVVPRGRNMATSTVCWPGAHGMKQNPYPAVEGKG